jgi:hypothetical protein
MFFNEKGIFLRNFIFRGLWDYQTCKISVPFWRLSLEWGKKCEMGFRSREGNFYHARGERKEKPEKNSCRLESQEELISLHQKLMNFLSERNFVVLASSLKFEFEKKAKFKSQKAVNNRHYTRPSSQHKKNHQPIRLSHGKSAKLSHNRARENKVTALKFPWLKTLAISPRFRTSHCDIKPSDASSLRARLLRLCGR